MLLETGYYFIILILHRAHLTSFQGNHVWFNLQLLYVLLAYEFANYNTYCRFSVKDSSNGVIC